MPVGQFERYPNRIKTLCVWITWALLSVEIMYWALVNSQSPVSLWEPRRNVIMRTEHSIIMDLATNCTGMCQTLLGFTSSLCSGIKETTVLLVQ